MQLKPGAHVYFMGIAGTGMAAVAGLTKAAGFKVTGSDKDVFPPMSTMLDELGIPVATPYAKANVSHAKPDMVVIANALSRGHEELEYVMENKVPYTSFPELVGEVFLKHKTSLVVCGTHGKTTTTSLMAHILESLKQSPSFMIGGIPKNFPYSFQLGTGQVFVIEGDEYDTAFFDKDSKFLHYYPKHVIFNNLEFDHADIFKDVAAIDRQFKKLLAKVANPHYIVANWDDEGVKRVIGDLGLAKEVTRVSPSGRTPGTHVAVKNFEPIAKGTAATVTTEAFGEINFTTKLVGPHNIANIAQCLAVLGNLAAANAIARPSHAEIATALATFEGVKRRLESLGTVGGVDIFEDFAHHPTAVRLVIEAFRKSRPKSRVVVAFDPRNATSRRNIFMQQFAESLAIADKVYIGKCTVDERIPENERMNTGELARRTGAKAQSFEDNDLLLSSMVKELAPGDAVIFMSCGSFSGIQHRLSDELRKKFRDFTP